MSALLEREEQLQVLIDATATAALGAGIVVLVQGEPGVGKSSLVRAYLGQLSVDTRTFVGACDDLITPRALGPLHDSVRWRGGPLADALANGSDRDQVFGAVVEELSHPRDVAVLVVEDVHWADDATLDVLQYVVRRIDALRAVVVLSYRDSDVRDDDSLRTLLGTIPGRSLYRIAVPRLTRTAVEALAHGTGRDAQSVYAVTAGNAFFVTELLAAADAMPATVVDAVLARVRQLDAPTQRAIEQLSVVPTGAGHGLVESLVGGLEVLTEAERRGMLRVDRERVAFRHELARRAIEQSLPQARRVALNRAVVAALAADPEADLARVLHHAVEANDVDTIVSCGATAARAAAHAGSHREALAHFEQLLRHEERLPPAELPRLLDEYAWELYNAHRFAQAATVAFRSCQLWPAVGDASDVGGAWIAMSRHRWMCSDVAGAWEAINEAAAILDRTDDVYARAHAHVYRGAILALQERVDEAVPELDLAQRLAEAAGSETLIALCQNYRGVCAAAHGEEAEALRLLRESVTLAKAAHDVVAPGDRAYAGEHLARGYINLAATLQLSEGWDELEDLLAEGLPYVIDSGFTFHLHNLRVREAALLVHRGAWDAAEVQLRDLPESVSDPGTLGEDMLPLYGRILARRGRPDAETVLERALLVTESSGVPGPLGQSRLAYLEWAWLSGVPQRAARHLSRSLAELQEDRHRRQRAELIRYGQRAGLLTAMPTDNLPEPWASAIRGDWFAAAAGFQSKGEDYERALELASSGDAAVTTTALEILDRIGADAAADLVRQQLRRMGVTRIPRGPVPATRGNPAGLTDRQIDVLRLVRDGLTNAEIAGRLYLSVRTVDHHVAAILDKLHVPSRREAADRAAGLGVS